jgi:hypothetical protein
MWGLTRLCQLEVGAKYKLWDAFVDLDLHSLVLTAIAAVILYVRAGVKGVFCSDLQI